MGRKWGFSHLLKILTLNCSPASWWQPKGMIFFFILKLTVSSISFPQNLNIWKKYFEILRGKDSVFPLVKDAHFLNCSPASWWQPVELCFFVILKLTVYSISSPQNRNFFSDLKYGFITCATFFFFFFIYLKKVEKLWRKAGFTSECEQNANAACENEAIV